MGKTASFDIETFCPVEELAEEDREYLRKRKDYASEEAFRRDLFTNPYVSFLISFSLFLLEDSRAYVFYLSEEDVEEVDRISIGEQSISLFYRGISLKPGLLHSEGRLLKHLWEQLENIDTLVTFYGRDFDMEFVKIRTLMHRIKPGAFYRYFHSKAINHVDLREVFRVGKNNYSLNFISRRLNMPMDKGGMDGSKIGEVFLSREYRKVAEYNLRDAVLTGLLYKRVRDYLPHSSVQEIFRSLGFSEGKELIEYALEHNLLSVKETSALIDLCKGRVETGPTDRQVVYLRDLANTHRPDMSDVCTLLSHETIYKILKSLQEDEIT